MTTEDKNKNEDSQSHTRIQNDQIKGPKSPIFCPSDELGMLYYFKDVYPPQHEKKVKYFSLN